eukprot:1181605-Prorocentrum_minimum.AAC.1
MNNSEKLKAVRRCGPLAQVLARSAYTAGRRAICWPTALRRKRAQRRFASRIRRANASAARSAISCTKLPPPQRRDDHHTMTDPTDTNHTDAARWKLYVAPTSMDRKHYVPATHRMMNMLLLPSMLLYVNIYSET